MRIIAGTLKGRRLATPDWDGLRPTSDRLRETLFNVLAPRVAEARVLDGCAGTGAIGIEALSRGARHVTFVERDRRAVALIRDNLRKCGVEAGYTIEPGDVTTALRRQARDGPDRAFDIVILDPPYDLVEVESMLDAAAACVAPGGLVVLERATRREPVVPASLHRLRDITSGDSSLTLLTRTEAS
jgi:16S rRNA (guanine(966)-N(2))-methyltransferase RsmD